MRRMLAGFLMAFLVTACQKVDVLVEPEIPGTPGGGGTTIITNVIINTQGPITIKTGTGCTVTVTVSVKVMPETADQRVTFTSSNSSVASVHPTTGVITGHTAGEIIIIVTSVADPSKKAEIKVIVTVEVCVPSTGNITSIKVSPDSANITVGSTLQLQAICFSGQTVVPCPAGLWWFSDHPEHILVDPNTGRLTAIAVGSARICVQISRTMTTPFGCGNFRAVSSTPTVTSISLSVTVINAFFGVGCTTPTSTIIATVLPLDAPQSVEWSFTGTGFTVVNGVVTITGVGSGTITARSTVNTQISITISITIVACNVGPTNVTVVPSNITLRSGIGCAATFPLTAVTVPAGSPVTWTSSDTTVATVDAFGVVTRRAASGVAVITARAANGVFGIAVVTVLAENCTTPGTISITPGAISAQFGVGCTTSPIQINVTTSPAGLPVTFTSLNTAVATVSSTGLVTITGTGSGTIRVTLASDPNVRVDIPVTVVSCTTGPTSVTIIPSSVTLPGGIGCASTVQLTAVTNPPGSPVTWTSSNNAIATVDATGKVTRMGIGTVTIRATAANGVFGTATVTFTADNCSGISIVIDQPSGSGAVGTTQQLTATVSNAPPGFLVSPWWSSSSPDRVAVMPEDRTIGAGDLVWAPGFYRAGTIKFVAPGSATICVQVNKFRPDIRDCKVFTAF